jgi:hypothetical protein
MNRALVANALAWALVLGFPLRADRLPATLAASPSCAEPSSPPGLSWAIPTPPGECGTIALGRFRREPRL